jgi:hypothetical protein
MADCISYYNALPIVPINVRVEEELECMGLGTGGSQLSYQQWTDRWNEGAGTTLPCVDVFKNIIMTGTDGVTRGYNSVAMAQVKEDFNYMWARLLNTTTQKKLTLPGRTGFDAFQSILLDACIQIPGACDTASTNLCAGCIDDRSKIAALKPRITLCGCSAPAISFVDGVIAPGWSNECDPLCSQQISAKKRDSDGDPIVCNAAICVIDNVSVAASQSSYGGIQFQQVCPSCAYGGDCKCIVDVSVRNTIESINSDENISLSNKAYFEQVCPGAICMEVDSVTQESTVVDCNTYLQEYSPPDPTVIFPKSVYSVAIGLILFVAIVILAFWWQSKSIFGYKSDPSKPGATKRVPIHW